MKRLRKAFLLAVCTGFLMLLSSCNGQMMAKDFGGKYTLELEPGYKLVEITWKDDEQLWYLIRPFEDGEEPTTYYFRESSGFGIIEGEVTIIESKKED